RLRRHADRHPVQQDGFAGRADRSGDPRGRGEGERARFHVDCHPWRRRGRNASRAVATHFPPHAAEIRSGEHPAYRRARISRQRVSQRRSARYLHAAHRTAFREEGGGTMRAGDLLDVRVPLGELLDLRSFREVCNSFADLYRIGVKVIDGSGAVLVDVTSGSNEFCSYLYSNLEGARRCSAVIQEVKYRQLDGPTVVAIPCFSGLRYLAIPLVYEGDVVGRAVFGPFVPQELADLPQAIKPLPGLDLANGRRLMAQIRRAQDSTIARVLEHFAGICSVLIFSAYQVYLTSKMHIESVRESYREVVAKAEKLEESLTRLKELD